uniref:Uncharacterized protein n=1 Tax=Anguilla anguilla TaxID=7936 RepID=A0A0E9V3T4_ANGAN
MAAFPLPLFFQTPWFLFLRVLF